MKLEKPSIYVQAVLNILCAGGAQYIMPQKV